MYFFAHDHIKQAGASKVGSTPSGLPFTFLDAKTNDLQGIKVDVIREVAKEIGDSITLTPLSFSALIPSLTSGKIDLISAAMFATAARKEIVDFSGTVYRYGEALVVKRSNAAAYRSFADLKGQTVGTQIGTTFVESLKNSASSKM